MKEDLCRQSRMRPVIGGIKSEETDGGRFASGRLTEDVCKIYPEVFDYIERFYNPKRRRSQPYSAYLHLFADGEVPIIAPDSVGQKPKL
jgi:hypothetical protein